MASISKRTINALSGEIIQFLMIRIHDNFFLIGILKGLDTWQRHRVVIFPRNNIRTYSQPIQITSQHVHEYSLSNIISIVPSYNLITAQLYGTTFQCLPSKYTTVRAIIGSADYFDYLVHCPPVELLIRHYKQWQVLLFLIPLNSLKRVIPIPLDSFINGQHIKLHSILILLVQFVHHVHNNSTILSSTCPYCDLVSFFEKLIADDGLVDLLFEKLKKTLLAHWLEIFGAFYECFTLFADLAQKFHHYGRFINYYNTGLFFYFQQVQYKAQTVINVQVNNKITIMNHSIITEYQEDHHQFSPTTLKSQYGISKSPERPNQDLYMGKLEAKIKELKNNIKKNKPIIQQLKSQRKFLKKIYEKQKQKIEMTKIENIKQQYEDQIQQLRQQRHKHEDIIAMIHEQSSTKAKDFTQAKQQIKQNRNQLLRVLEQVKKENACYGELLINKEKVIEAKRLDIAEMMAQVRSKTNIEKRYRQVLSQIESMEYYRNQ